MPVPLEGLPRANGRSRVVQSGVSIPGPVLDAALPAGLAGAVAAQLLAAVTKTPDLSGKNTARHFL